MKNAVDAYNAELDLLAAEAHCAAAIAAGVVVDLPDCDTCIHAAECAEIDGRQEGRGYGMDCDEDMEPHYEKRL